MRQLDEFCDHCAKKNGTSNSFVGLAKQGAVAKVICKGCGIITVDHQGRCLKCKPKMNKKYPLMIGTLLIMMSLIFLIPII